MLLVFLTEGVFDEQPGHDLLDVLQQLRNRDMRVLWITETDMRHFYGTESPKHTGWREALTELSSRGIPTEHNATALAIQLHAFASVIPFYKDKAFRDVSIHCMLEALGAERIEAGPAPEQNLERSESVASESGGTARRQNTAVVMPASVLIPGSREMRHIDRLTSGARANEPSAEQESKEDFADFAAFDDIAEQEAPPHGPPPGAALE